MTYAPPTKVLGSDSTVFEAVSNMAELRDLVGCVRVQTVVRLIRGLPICALLNEVISDSGECPAV